MAVYVDDMYTTPMGNFRGMKMSHMIADTRVELLEMATKIGVAHKWIQEKNTRLEHFDVCLSARSKAVSFGAIEIGMRVLARQTIDRGKDEGWFKRYINQ